MKEKVVVKERDYFFDNLRAIFIFLVVFGHFIGPLGQVFEIKFLYRYLYIFHMAGMLFISGFFFKKSVEDGKLVKNKIFNYILLYCVFQALFTIINQSRFGLFQAQMGLWYIQLLIYYSLLMPVITRIKPSVCILGSIAFGLLVGLDKSAGHVASLSRALVFMPFFLIGFYMKKEYIQKLFKKEFVVIGLIALIVIGAILYMNLNELPQLLNMSSGKLSYAAMKMDSFEGVSYRLSWYLATAIIIIFVMMVTPRFKCFFSSVGQKTLQIFILHLIAVVILRKTPLYTFLLNFDDWIVVTISLVASAVLTYILSLKIFSYPFDYLMNLKFKMLLKDSENK